MGYENLNINKASITRVIYSDLCELVHRALQQGGCILSLISLLVKQVQLPLHLQQPRLSLIQ